MNHENDEATEEIGPGQTELEFSGPAPLLRGLRKRGDEAQLTQVIGRMAATSVVFAHGYAETLLAAAARIFPGRAASVAPVPSDLSCAPEYSLGLQEGRVDVRLHAPGFTLLVEHKLHSDFGFRQLERYRRAVDRLPPGRHALVAVTRNAPTPTALGLSDSPRWLGIVRWRAILDGLHTLEHDDRTALAQWRALLRIIEDEGDFGVAQVDQRDLETWGRFSAVRTRFVDVLDEARTSAEDRLRLQLAAKRYATSDRLLSLVTHKRTGRTAIKVTQREAWVGWSLPAARDVVISLGFAANERTSTTDLHVVVWPRDLPERYQRDPSTQRAVRALEDQSFNYSSAGNLRRVHAPDQWARADDIVERIIEIFADDIAVVLATGILRDQYKQSRRQSGRLPRRR